MESIYNQTSKDTSNYYKYAPENQIFALEKQTRSSDFYAKFNSTNKDVINILTAKNIKEALVSTKQ